MSDPYVGEIRMFAGNFAPNGWNFCDGSLQSIANYETLFNLLVTTYGGDGQNTFGLPDLRGRLPIHSNQSFPLGSLGGVESVTLFANQLPTHSHLFAASNAAPTTTSPSGAVLGSNPSAPVFTAGAPVAAMTTSVAYQGGSQPHDNMMPYLTINFIISLYGVYPSQS